ncbi:MAG: TrkA family potassium uptake protein [Acutalibacteraceae bacterium]|nr:TrkA family potassium uptake protein [Acutalibacteraceae bacterium]
MKSILVIGLGRFGSIMADKLENSGNSVLGIDISEKRADDAVSFLRNIQIGDATDERFIESLGVSNFDVCVVAVGGENFQTVLEITVLLKDYGAKCIVARANRDVHEKLLLRNGADYVMCADREAAEKLAIKYGSKNIFDYIEITNEYGLYEIPVPVSWIGKTIAQVNVRSRYNINIIATKYNNNIHPTIKPDYVFNNCENLLIMGTENDIRKFFKS